MVHPSIRVMTDDTIEATCHHAATNYVGIGRTSFEVATQLRRHLDAALAAKFGESNVEPGKKAFRVSAVPGSRADIDVVPALTLDYVTLCAGQNLMLPSYVGPVRGVAIFGTDGAEIVNFPFHHNRYGIQKRARTKHRFKRLVRQLKSMRDDLVENGKLPQLSTQTRSIYFRIFSRKDLPRGPGSW